MNSKVIRARCSLGLNFAPSQFGYKSKFSNATYLPSIWSRLLSNTFLRQVPGSNFPASFSTYKRDPKSQVPKHFVYFSGTVFQRPRPLDISAGSRLFTPFCVSGCHLSTRRIGNRKQETSTLLQFSSSSSNWSATGILIFSSSVTSMASSGKIDLNSPSTSWKEAKNYLKGLNHKQRREQYSVKDYIKLKQIPAWKDTAKKLKVKQPEEVKYPKNKDLIEKISLFRGDITKLEVDAIVNTANSSLLGGGGVDGCIHRTAGPLLKLECSSLGGCETGQAKVTCGYLLHAKCVIHTVGPVAQGQPGPTQEEELKNCYKNSMKLAAEGKLRTVAFPCISTGVFGYPAEAAADVALGTLRNFLEENKDKFDRVIICVFLEKDEEIYLAKLPEYFPLA
ncbi:ADP-ribose glycohydrolase MACROD1 [Rhinophrynus dorsalis]